DEVVNRCVVALRIMVSERELFCLCKSRDCPRVFDRAMAPAGLLSVFAREVLRVVHHQIGASEEFGVTTVLSGNVTGAGSECTRMRFMITRVDDGDAVCLETVTQG